LDSLFEPNPVLVRELKQFVRNRMLLYFMLSYLGVLAVVTILVMVEPAAMKGIGRYTLGWLWFENGTSNEMFRFVMLTYYLFTSTLLMLFGAVKMGNERLHNDLGFFTTLPPRRVVSGKLMLGVFVSLVFLSVSLPFATIAYMMRGLDLLLVFNTACLLFLFTQLHYVLAVTFLSGAKTLTRIYLFGLTLLVLQGLTYFFGIVFASELSLDNRVPQGVIVNAYLITILAIAVLIPFAVCQLSPESSDRMKPVRIGLTGVCLLMIFVFVFYFLAEGNGWSLYGCSDAIEGFAIGITFCVFMFYPYLSLISICEREDWSIRQRIRLPESPFLRLLLFPFSTGVYNAICWHFCYLAVSAFFFAVAYTLSENYQFSNDFGEFVRQGLWRLLSFSILMFDYTVTAFLLWKLVLHRWLSREKLAFSLFVFSACCLTVLVIFEMFWHREFDFNTAMFFLPTVLIGDGYHDAGVIFQYVLAIFWGLVLIPIFLPLLLRRFKHYTRHQIDDE